MGEFDAARELCELVVQQPSLDVRVVGDVDEGQELKSSASSLRELELTERSHVDYLSTHRSIRMTFALTGRGDRRRASGNPASAPVRSNALSCIWCPRR